MNHLKPKLLLIGEAPGYKGCRLTGVPFTSEYILITDIPESNLFGPSRGYKVTDERPGLTKEATATIIWNTIMSYGEIPLLWNAFPFHPYRTGNCWSNRPPSSNELDVGISFLREIIEIFEIREIVAVGKNAEKSLSRLSKPFSSVRHPSCGGKPEFVNGMRNILENRCG